MQVFKKELRVLNKENNSLKQYLNDINKVPLLTDDEEFEYALLSQNGDEDALNKLVRSNLRFVVSVAKQYIDKNSPIEDLINEGNIGLIRAAKRFDPTKGFKFISYAVWWIRLTINAYKTEHSRFIKLPGHQVILISKMNKASNILEQEHCRPPSMCEISNYIGVETSQIDKLINMSNIGVVSLETPISNNECRLLDILSSDDCRDDSDKNHLNTLLNNSLTEREIIIINLSYGLDDIIPLTLE